MTEKSDIEQSLEEIAVRVANGGEITLIEIEGIASLIEIEQIKEDLLPGPKTISGSPEDRKDEMFKIVESIWGVSPRQLLDLEKEWQKSARAKSGSKETGGKDSTYDVVSAEILVRLIGTIKIVADYNQREGGQDVVNEAIVALNLALNETACKGRTRIQRYGKKTVYSVLKDAGIMIGTGGGKYLPDPETSLTRLFLMLGTGIISSAYV